MSLTLPVELNGNEYISEIVINHDPTTDVFEYFVKINGDPACFVNFRRLPEQSLIEERASLDLTPEFKLAVKKTLQEHLDNTPSAK
jgi:hypothetical protein